MMGQPRSPNYLLGIQRSKEIREISQKYSIPISVRIFLSDFPGIKCTWKCQTCGKKKKSYIVGVQPWWDHPFKPSATEPMKHYIHGECRKCRITRMQREIEKGSWEMRGLVDQNQALLVACKTMGSCDIFAAHHEILKEDPERLSTEFLVKMVCGMEKHSEYLKVRAE